MKIYVLSKKELKKIGYIDKTFFTDEKRYFISIAGIADGCEYPHPFLTKDSKRVLHLLFDDVTEKHTEEFGYDPSIILFDNEHANKIFEFIKTIPNKEFNTYNNSIISSIWYILFYNYSCSRSC